LQLKHPRRDFVWPLLSNLCLEGEFPELLLGLAVLDRAVLTLVFIDIGTKVCIEPSVSVLDVPEAELSSAM
jgi:hypothetical protein